MTSGTHQIIHFATPKRSFISAWATPTGVSLASCTAYGLYLMDGSSKARLWISASAHYGRDDRALGPRAIMHIDQLRSQESFSAHLFLSLAVTCALYKLLYKIYALTYVSTRTYTTKVRFHCSLAAIYQAQHDTSSALSLVQGIMCCWLRVQMACRCGASRSVRAAGVRCACGGILAASGSIRVLVATQATLKV